MNRPGSLMRTVMGGDEGTLIQAGGTATVAG